jgi:chromosome segregation ATPase
LNALSEELNETKQLAQENNMFVKALPALSTKVVAIERKVNATENKVAELEKFRTTMAQQHLNLKYDTYDKIDALDNQVALNEEMIVSLTQELESVKATSDQNAMFVKAMPNLATKTASNEAKILELNQEVSSLNEKVSSMESALNQNDLLADLQATYFDVKKTAYRAKNIGDSLEKDLLAISQEVSSLNEEIAKAQDNTMLWLVAGLGVVLGVVGIFLP